MINKILVKIYSVVPRSVKLQLGQSQLLKPLRDTFLRRKESYVETKGLIQRNYGDYIVKFYFFSDIQNVARAKKKGIESTLLRNSIILLNKHKSDKNDCVVLDVGANFGFLSLVWGCSVCKEEGRVFAFEPNPYVYNTFLKSIGKNGLTPIIKAAHNAVGSKNKTIQLYLNNTTSNTLQTETSTKSTDIEMISIDNYIRINKITRCDLIKIDVDGIELDILEGSISTLEKLRPIFIVETNDNKGIIDFFANRDYLILDMELKEYKEDNILPDNIFCVP